MIVHIVGIIAMLCIIFSVQMKHKDKFLILQISGALFFGIYFILLGGYAGGITNAILVFQGLIAFYFLKQDQTVPKYIIGILLSITFISSLYVVNSFLDVLPLLGVVISLIIYLQSSEQRIRLLSLILAVWIPYNIYFEAHFSLITSIFFLVSTLIAIYRYDLKKT